MNTFIVCDGYGYIKSVYDGMPEYTSRRDEAHRFEGKEWMEYWQGIPGVVVVPVERTPAQQMADAGAARLPGIE